MTKAEQLAANTRTDAATSTTWIPLDDLKVVFISITEDLVQMITDTYRRIDKLARNTQQTPSIEDLPCASHNWGLTYRKQTILTISNTRQLHYGQFSSRDWLNVQGNVENTVH
ncbi:unnamed protein product [Arabidopsis halleri]